MATKKTPRKKSTKAAISEATPKAKAKAKAKRKPHKSAIARAENKKAIAKTPTIVETEDFNEMAGRWLTISPTSVVVKTEEDYTRYTTELKELATLRAKIKERKEHYYRPIKTALDRISADVRVVDDPLKTLENAMRRENARYLDGKYETALRKSQVRADKAREAGNVALAANIEALVDIQEHVPPVAGVGIAQTTSFAIVAPELLPAEYLQPDEKKIAALVKAIGAKAESMLNGAVKVSRKSMQKVSKV